MNKRQIIASLNKIANELDSALLFVEANTITKVMTRLADEFDMGNDPYNVETTQPKTQSEKHNEDFHKEVMRIINNDDYNDKEVKRATGTLINYLSEPDSREEYRESVEDMYPLGRPQPKSQTLSINLMYMTDNYIRKNKLSYNQIKDLVFTLYYL
jgi:ABC-type dipeptide/oligopeptide/nickel transport system ATPase component